MTFAGDAIKTATGTGLIVMILVCVIVLLHASVKVQVSVTGPPQDPGKVLNVEVTVPLIKHVPPAPFV